MNDPTIELFKKIIDLCERLDSCFRLESLLGFDLK